MRGPRILYVSGSIGLGHVSKDLAIARELRRARPDIEIVWLAGHPASQVLHDAGERVAPECARWVGASAIAERCTRGGQLNLVRYVYRSLPSWARNTRLFRAAVHAHDIDIAVGNEAWEVDIPLVLGVLRLPVPFVMIFDFVGCDAMAPNLLDSIGAYGLNALWALDGRVYHSRACSGHGHSALFIGEPDDVPDKALGWALPNRREHARSHYQFVGHAIGFRPEDFADRAAWRHALGYGGEPLIVCAAGGTSIGRDLLELCGAAWLPLRESLPDVHMVLVCGPRLPVESVRAPEGVEIRGYVPRLHEHFACSDVAVVQCGASSTTELAALRRPFVYFPVDGHFEQEIVATRLARYGVGRRMSPSRTTPTELAAAIRGEYARPVTSSSPPSPSLPTDGARTAAKQILRVLEDRAAARGDAGLGRLPQGISPSSGEARRSPGGQTVKLQDSAAVRSSCLPGTDR
jgi:UDP-N-acetylglucosamine:LPS N-acetylglucosamine transferase